MRAYGVRRSGLAEVVEFLLTRNASWQLKTGRYRPAKPIRSTRTAARSLFGFACRTNETCDLTLNMKHRSNLCVASARKPAPRTQAIDCQCALAAECDGSACTGEASRRLSWRQCMGTPARSSSSSGCASAQQRPARECSCGPDAAAAVTLLTDICACRKPDETSALLPHLLKVACRHGRTRVALLILTEATQRGETDPDLPGAISVHLKHFRGEIAAAFTFLLVAFKPKGKAALLPPAVAARIVERYSTPRGIPPRTVSHPARYGMQGDCRGRGPGDYGLLLPPRSAACARLEGGTHGRRCRAHCHCSEGAGERRAGRLQQSCCRSHAPPVCVQ